MIEHPSRDAGERTLRQRALEEERRKRDDTALEKALKDFLGFRLGLDDREKLARNIGRIAEDRGPGAPKAILRRSFKRWSEPRPGADEQEEARQFKRMDYRWKKRTRWARLETDPDTREPPSPRAQDYKELALAIAQRHPIAGITAEQNKRRALWMLLSGTSFNPDKSGQSGADLETKLALTEHLSKLRETVIRDAPGLPAYFGFISDHALTHDEIKVTHDDLEDGESPSWNHFGRDETRFSICGWGEFGARTDGHLIPEALCEGFHLSEKEGHGLAATFPRVPLAEITLAISLPALEWRVLWAKFHDPLLSQSQNSEQVIRRALTDNLFADRSLSPTFSEIDFESSWRIHLVVAPWGGREERNLQLGLVVEEMSAPNLIWSMAEVELYQFPDSGEHALIDTRPLAVDPIRDRLFEMTDRLWLAKGDHGSIVLTTKSLSWVEVETFSPLLPSGFTPRIKPLFVVPAVPTDQAPTPIVTLAGMIERNILAAKKADRLDVQLLTDAKRRVATLQVNAAAQ